MLPLIIIGFAMITLGVALLLIGAVPFLGGKRISAWRSRLIGLVMVSFLPMAMGLFLGFRQLFSEEAIAGPILTWVLCGFCWFLVGVILFRVVAPKGGKRQAKTAPAFEPANNDLFGEAAPEDDALELELIEEEDPTPAPAKKAEAPKAAPAKKPEAVKKAPAKKAPKPAVEEENPFDFS